ncbi:Hypothetical_protein [Hexamita inflata]|uniref:Hypothetical_protein n=1 Tax=Hexamita inflata TaxID=28002 RepID=A0AA86TQ02_9EUKA|nr:Hypothetical protein HINF_LOCUS11670 [Hexamita inflata]
MKKVQQEDTKLQLFLPIQKISTEENEIYVLFDKPTTKLTRTQQLLPLTIVDFETDEIDTEGDTTEVSEFQNIDLDKRRQIFEKQLNEAKQQMFKLIVEKKDRDKKDDQTEVTSADQKRTTVNQQQQPIINSTNARIVYESVVAKPEDVFVDINVQSRTFPKWQQW